MISILKFSSVILQNKNYNKQNNKINLRHCSFHEQKGRVIFLLFFLSLAYNKGICYNCSSKKKGVKDEIYRKFRKNN